MWPAREELLLATASLPPPGEQLLPAHIARWATVCVGLIIAVQCRCLFNKYILS